MSLLEQRNEVKINGYSSITFLPIKHMEFNKLLRLTIQRKCFSFYPNHFISLIYPRLSEVVIRML